MRDFRPIIGVTLSAQVRMDTASRQAAEAYCQALTAQGADTVELVPGEMPPRVEVLDGLLLAGGVDVGPDHYGEAGHTRLGRVDPMRDAMELPLTRQAAAQGLPVLGICRGAQVIAVASGGKLHQDLPSDLGTSAHAVEGEVGARHRVRVAAGSRLGAILGVDALEVNSFHHQAISAVGPGLQAVAWSEDDVVEAVESESAVFLIGVQWHPERMLESESARRLFAVFAEAARDYAKGKGTRG